MSTSTPLAPKIRRRTKAVIKVEFDLSNPQHQAIYDLCRMFNSDMLPNMLGYGCEKFKQEMQKALANLHIDESQLAQAALSTIGQTPAVSPTQPQSIAVVEAIRGEQAPPPAQSAPSVVKEPSVSDEPATSVPEPETPEMVEEVSAPEVRPPVKEVFDPNALPPAGVAGEHVVQNPNLAAAKRLL